MKPLYKVIIVLVAAIVLVSAMASAFNQIATSPILTRNLNAQDEHDIPDLSDIPNINITDPNLNLPPGLNDTIFPPELNITIPDSIISGNLTSGTNLSGTVFTDMDGDGVPDPGEVQPNVGVQLFDQNGTLIATTQTDENGNYNFTGIDPGKYNVTTFPGTNGDVIGGTNQTIDVGDSPLNDIDLNTTSKPDDRPTIETVTDIASNLEVVKKGVHFPVSGTVRTTSGTGLSGLPVMVYMAADKVTTERHFIGAGTVHNGIFTANCMIPDDLVLGSYQLIAKCLGNGTYKPSESDPEVRIIDDSKMTIECPDRVVMGSYVNVVMTLMENSSSKPVSNAEITFTVSYSQNAPYGGRGWTDSAGAFSWDMSMMYSGTYNISANFNGNSNLNGTKANKTVTVLDITVDISPSYLVRGYDNKLYVLVHASELPITNTTVKVYLEDLEAGSYMTDRSGRFNATLPVSYYQPLGACTMDFQVASIKYCQKSLTVKSMTTMHVKIEGNNVNATLLDDRNQTMLQMPIFLQDPDRTDIDVTNSRTGAEFSVRTDKESDYVVLFNGSSIYVASSATVHYTPSGTVGQGNEWLTIGAVGALALAVVVGFMVFRRRIGTGPTGEVVAPMMPVAPPALPTSPYIITFPMIEQGMPLVWGGRTSPSCSRSPEGMGSSIWTSTGPAPG